MIREKLEKIKEEIRKICHKNDINKDNIRLIAVSKTQTVETILEAYHCGIRDFGENKVQELLEKRDRLPTDIRWHMIGHLQSNKVRSLLGKVELIHSIDSLKLARIIEEEARKKDIVVRGLVDVNVAKEASKYGFSKEELFAQLEDFGTFRHLRIVGLMTVAPFVEDEEENREVFRNLKQIAVDINAKKIDNVQVEYLSMGMSGDFRTAIEEGASLVRIGTAIFGSRQVK